MIVMTHPCPACGLAVIDHTDMTVYQAHVVAFLADPDRSADDVLDWTTGVVFATGRLIDSMTVGPDEIVSGLTRLLSMLREVTRRRSAMRDEI